MFHGTPWHFYVHPLSWGNSLQFDGRISFRWVGWNSTTNQPVIGGVYWQNPMVFFFLRPQAAIFLPRVALVDGVGWTCEIIDTGPWQQLCCYPRYVFFVKKCVFLVGKEIHVFFTRGSLTYYNLWTEFECHQTKPEASGTSRSSTTLDIFKTSHHPCKFLPCSCCCQGFLMIPYSSSVILTRSPQLKKWPMVVVVVVVLLEGDDDRRKVIGLIYSLAASITGRYCWWKKCQTTTWDV